MAPQAQKWSQKAENYVAKMLSENVSHPGTVYAARLHFLKNKSEIYFTWSKGEKNTIRQSLLKNFNGYIFCNFF